MGPILVNRNQRSSHITRTYNRRVQRRLFKPRNLVLKSIEVMGKYPSKIRSNWGGPYHIKQELYLCTFRLLTLGSKGVPYT